MSQQKSFKIGTFSGKLKLLIFRQTSVPVALQVRRPGRADDVAGRAAVHASRLGRADPLGPGAKRRQVAEPDQVHRTLQQHELLVQVSCPRKIVCQ